jgi:dTDP-4-amino-4,6-dideoxygalactose transaminase
MLEPIPFNRPCVADGTESRLAEVFASGHMSGDGPMSRRCQALLEEILGAPRVLLTTSCTHALEMAAHLLNLGPGDEVVFPSFTFVSTVNAFVLRGVRPVFADIRADTLNLNEDHAARLIGPRVRAIAPVHYAGVGCEMDAIGALAERHGLAVVEDAAHGLFGRYRDRMLGTFGRLATLSFHETKNISCGEGGALVLNDASLIDRAEVLREKGTNRSRFFRGQVDKYSWVDVGSSWAPSDVLAALLFAQLQMRERIQARRRQIWCYYADHLRDWALAQGVRLPAAPAHCEQPYHMFYLLAPSLVDRQALIAHLKALGVHSVFHYLPLHLSPMGRRFGGAKGDCPMAEAVSDRLLRLPFFYDLTEGDLARIVASVRSFRTSAGGDDWITRARQSASAAARPSGLTVAMRDWLARARRKVSA